MLPTRKPYSFIPKEPLGWVEGEMLEGVDLGEEECRGWDWEKLREGKLQLGH